MSWELEHSDAEKLVRITASGSVSTDEVLAQATASIKLIKEHQSVGALVDYSKVVLEMPIVEIYKLPDLFDVLALPRATKIAIVLPPDPKNMHKYTFFDDTANNRGYMVKLYWEPTQAMAWLTDGQVHA